MRKREAADASSARPPRRNPPAVTKGLYGVTVEYGLHVLLWLIGRERAVSSRDLAALQGVSPSLLAKILPKLEKAALVASSGGISGGYRLAREAASISVLDVVDALEAGKGVLGCKEVRRNCALFDGAPPAWASRGTCGIHAVMLRAEKALRDELARTSLQDLASGVPYPLGFGEQVAQWFDDRGVAREQARVSAVRSSRRRREGVG